MHLGRLMTSWAVVCDVWYLEPQYLREGETTIEFAER
jgi:glycerol-3-phosphate O-acyltransferase 3/4